MTLEEKKQANEGTDFAVILGAGFSGICIAIKLKQAGIENFTILEKSNAVGGTWNFNRYPGSSCDIESHLYSYSFFPKPDWSCKYANAEEIQEYLNAAVNHFGLLSHIRFEQDVRSATYDEKLRQWHFATKNNQCFAARFFISATGSLHQPSYPKLPGLGSFVGKSMHSSQWDASFSPEGRRIFSIGTGASAIQYLPELAKKAKALYVLQRTPAWVVPKVNFSYSRNQIERFRKLRFLMKTKRLRLFLRNELIAFFVHHPKLMNKVENYIRKRILLQVNDRNLSVKLMPNYRLGCKRVSMSNDYYKMFNQRNVQLICEGIKQVHEYTVELSTGDHVPCDTILFGTGFVTDPRQYLTHLTIRGKSGLNLKDFWNDCPTSYLGLTVDHFPNFFLMSGPNTGLGHNSFIYMIERQSHYIVSCLKFMRSKRLVSLEIKEQSIRKYDRWVQSRLSRKVWNSGCQSWYLGKDRKNFSMWPGLCVSYGIRTFRPKFSDYTFESFKNC